MIVPIAGILIPLIKVVPRLYQWRIKRRIFYWYEQLKQLEGRVNRDVTLSRIEAYKAESDRIEASLLREDTGGDDADTAARESASTGSPMPRLEEFLRLQEREFIRQALQRHDFQIGVTADALGISRKSLWERMKRLAIG